MYTLRKPTPADEYFLFKVIEVAMLPTKQKINPKYTLDLKNKYKEYSSPYQLHEVDIIQSLGIDVGRLRVKKTKESIYIGGFQILPEFQNKGIGTAVLLDIIQEAKTLNIPIFLEVQKVNLQAKAFYERHHFKVISNNKDDLMMKFHLE